VTWWAARRSRRLTSTPDSSAELAAARKLWLAVGLGVPIIVFVVLSQAF